MIKTRTSSERPPNRRSRSRTLAAGRPSAAAISRWPFALGFGQSGEEAWKDTEVDGASLRRAQRKIVLPTASPGNTTTGMICFTFSWNERPFALKLTATTANTSPVYLVRFIISEGLLIARLSAAALVVTIPLIDVDRVAQDKLVQGLSLSAANRRRKVEESVCAP